MSGQLVAVTGGTGFLGRRLVYRLHATGWRVKILARDPANAARWDGRAPDIVIGSLEDADSLSRLMYGVDAVVHAAGLIKARSRFEFFAVNDGGARRVAVAAGGRRLILVSSLAAREPALSDYAASKRAGENSVQAITGGRATILRPPAIYGPGDRETLLLFKAALGPLVIAPNRPTARVAVAEVDDVASIIVDLLNVNTAVGTVTIGGERPAGYGWPELIRTAATAVGGRPAIITAPPWALKAAGFTSEAIGRWRGSPEIFTLGKAREALHLDWSVSTSEQGITSTRTYTKLDDGFARSVRWYRAHGWLR